MEYTYPEKLESDLGDGSIVTFPDVVEVMAAGENRDEVLEKAIEALRLALRSYPMLWSTVYIA